MVGSALVRFLRAEGHRVLEMVRVRGAADGTHVFWSPEQGEIDVRRLEGIDGIVHLAGENIAQRWSRDAKRRIRASRERGTALVAEALAALQQPPRVLVSGSAIGIYGSRGDEPLDESSSPGDDFLAETAIAWEAAADAARQRDIRVVHPRTGIVLSTSGGMLGRLLPIFRMGAGGMAGSGRQWLSWIALDDLVRALAFMLRTDTLEGPVNVVAPNPVTNAEFTATLGRLLRRPTVAHVPAFAVKLAFGEMGEKTILASQRVVPRKLLESGFTYLHPTLDEALRGMLATAAPPSAGVAF